MIRCANELCRSKETIPQDTLATIVETESSTETALRRARSTVRILNEYQITSAIDESMIQEGADGLKRYRQYIPLVGSFNNCRAAACAVDEDNPETIKQFLYAVFAFGVEVALWSIGAPYKMAWRGTRFISNRSLLRLARNGCRGCIAVAMSELHWAIRGTVYNADEVITASETEFVVRRLTQLQSQADEMNYEANIVTNREQVKSFIEDTTGQISGGGAPLPQESNGPLGRFVPEFDFDFEFLDLPELSDIF